MNKFNSLIVMRFFAMPMLMAFSFSMAHAQTKTEWSPSLQLQSTDFKSPVNEIGAQQYSILAACSIEFSYQMSQYEFMFTKNFNAKVSATFNPNASFYKISDSSDLNQVAAFAQLTFDLNELYARKLRQKLYEKKSTFTNASFFQPLYTEVTTEMNERHSQLIATTDIGRNLSSIQEADKAIREEIASLADFCQSCKPKKKKK